MNFIIRCVRLEDASSIASIIHELGWFEDIKSEPLTITEERIRKHIGLCLADESHSVFIAEDNSRKVIGYSSIHYLPYFFLKGPEGYISELFISSEARGSGVGTALLEEAVSDARKRGCSRVTLINSRTRESYKRKFYEQRGWRERTEVAAFVLPLE